MWVILPLTLSMISSGLCLSLRYPYFQIEQGSYLPTVYSVPQEANSFQQHEIGGFRLRTPRNDMNYQLLTVPSPSRTYRRYRSALPTSEDEDLQSYGGGRQLRILSWLFGRPGTSPFVRDYSSLEAAAGISQPGYGYPSRLNTMHSSSPLVVEECVEYYDSYYDEYIEDCRPTGMVH